MVGPSPTLDDLVRRALEDRAVDLGAAADAAPLGERDGRAAQRRDEPTASPQRGQRFRETLWSDIRGNVRAFLQHQNVDARVCQSRGDAGTAGAGADDEHVAGERRRASNGDGGCHQIVDWGAAWSLAARRSSPTAVTTSGCS